jgi:hypothetical protein
MRKVFLIVSILLFNYTLKAQESGKGWVFDSASVSLGAATYDDGGGYFGLDVNLRKDVHLLKAMGLFTAGLGILGDGLEAQEYDLMYGRELALGKRSWLELFAGLGYVRYERRDTGPGFESYFTDSLGVPLLARIRYDLGKRAELGFQVHANLNAGPDYYTGGFFFQFKF